MIKTYILEDLDCAHCAAKMEEAIKKINKIGKISGIFALISKILVGMGLFLLLAGVVVCFAVPESFIKSELGTEVDITVDMNSVDQKLSDADVEMMKKDMKQIKRKYKQ